MEMPPNKLLEAVRPPLLRLAQTVHHPNTTALEFSASLDEVCRCMEGFSVSDGSEGMSGGLATDGAVGPQPEILVSFGPKQTSKHQRTPYCSIRTF